MYEKKPSLDMDFSQAAFDVAVGQLECNPEEATIWIPAACITTAYKVQKLYSCKVIAIPNVLVKSNFCWAVADNRGGLFWSGGIQ